MLIATPVCHAAVTHQGKEEAPPFLKTGWTRDIQQGLTRLLQCFLGHGSLMPTSLLPFSGAASQMGRARWDPCVSPFGDRPLVNEQRHFLRAFQTPTHQIWHGAPNMPREPDLGITNPGAQQCGELSIAQRPAGRQGIFLGFALGIVVPAEV